jgi:hypothetical protein
MTRKLHHSITPLLFLCVLSVSVAQVQAIEAPPEEDPTAKKRGPAFSGGIRWRNQEDVIAYKGLVLTLGTKHNAFVCYDTELLRFSLGWVNDGKRFGLTVPKFNTPKPQVVGTPVFGTARAPGWAKGGGFDDPRDGKRGSLPKDWAHHKGFYQHGREVVLHYTVGAVEMLELPGFASVEGRPVFTRTIQPLQNASALAINLVHVPGAELSEAEMGVNVRSTKTGQMYLVACEGGMGAEWNMRGDSLTLKLASAAANAPFRIAMASYGKTDEIPPNDVLALPPVPTDLRPLTKGGPVLFPEVVTTQGERAADDAAYVVDRLTEPAKNPWNADVLFGGFDFFDDGRAAVCTTQGEVWIVSGIDDGLQKLEWRRFASGLFQPLGLKIVRGDVHVAGRDQITRLRDLNGDGEADDYANFNNDALLDGNGAEYSLDLQTDSAGNFYFGKATPYYPEITNPHQGVIFKVSPDGAKSEIIATGFRVPNGLAVSPTDEIAVSDQQGHWMPSSKLNLIRPGGFYGMMPAAQREIEMKWRGEVIRVNPSDPVVRKELGFTGWGGANPMPAHYFDLPLAWIPWVVDNSSGAPFWAITDKWGPLNNSLLFTSYGRCALFVTLRHKAGKLEQAAMVPLNLPFDSGIQRGRVNPRDGQVYVAGLRGWITTAVRDGGIYRVRYTGRPAHLPVDFKITKRGVDLTFSDALDPSCVVDLANITAERWNYYWSGNYGSRDDSLISPKEPKRDSLTVQAARLGDDAKTLTLDLAGMRTSHQLQLDLKIRTAQGAPITRTLYLTVPVLEE